MGFFGLYTYRNRRGTVFYLHMKQRQNSTIYYFSKKAEGALLFKPPGYVVHENKKTGMPMLKKGEGGIFAMLFGASSPEKGEQGRKKS